MPKRLHAVLLIIGVVCLGWMLHAVGGARVWRAMASLGWGLVPLVLLEGVEVVLRTRAWRHCLSLPARSRPFVQLFWMRVAGYAINYFTPTATLGGEVARASLIASPGLGPDAVSSVLVDKLCTALAHLMLVGAGAFFLLWCIEIPAALQAAMLLTGSLLAAGILVFLLIQKHGRLGSLFRWLATRRPGSRWGRLAENTTAVDEAFQAFYRDRRLDFVSTVGWHMAGFATGFLQVWLFFGLADLHPSAAVVAGVWAIGLWFDLLVFAVPMSLGTLEASRIATFAAVGYQAVEGLTFGMVMRLGQLTWAVVGLIGYAVLALKPNRRLVRDR
ncbi:MAG: lysylphosphatidylglycerol synthase domain-containing protein [Desulfobacteraceae bacterium]|nr:lysylphosphatidylglycerol synthase domain-containing protein [Desulfobacteraceae bacterium]